MSSVGASELVEAAKTRVCDSSRRQGTHARTSVEPMMAKLMGGVPAIDREEATHVIPRGYRCCCQRLSVLSGHSG